MYARTASETAEIAGCSLAQGPADAVCTRFKVDSRKVGPGDTFVAFVGEQADGNDYVGKALELGAAAVVMTREPDASELAAAEAAGAAVLVAEDATRFLQALATDFRAKHDWLVIGVTGSVGKTTTKELLAAALAESYVVHKNVGNFNSVIGVPLTILSAPEDTEAFVCEMGMNHVGEIAAIAACAKPEAALVTNIGTAHIGLLGSREAIARAKAEVVAELAQAEGARVPTLFLMAADDYTAFITDTFCVPAGVATATCGVRETDAVRVGPVTLDEGGHPSFTVDVAGKSVPVTLKLTGRAVVADFELALAAAVWAGADPEAAIAAMAAFEPPHMRQELVVTEGGVTLVDDTYNASPASVAAATDLLCALACQNRRILVLGEVGELGDKSRELHHMMGAYVAAKPLDLVCFVGGESADCMDEAARIMGLSEDRIIRVATADEAVSVLGPVLEAGDVVLAKGSRSVGLDRFIEGVRG